MTNHTQKSLIISVALHAAVAVGFIGFLTAKADPIKKVTTLCVASFQKEDRHFQQPKKPQKPERQNTAQAKPPVKQHADKPIQKEVQNAKAASGEKREEQKIAEAPLSPKHQAQESKDESKEYIDANLAKIREAIVKHKRYPSIAVKMGCEGVCSVSFRLHPSGDIEEVKIVKSSGFASLDRSSIQTVENAASEMPRPYKIVTITIPIEYKLN